MAFGLTSAGLVLPRAADFIASVEARYEDLTGEKPDWERDLVIRNFLVAVANEFDALSEHVQAIYDSFDENNAAGLQLENIAAITPGISKLRATKSQVTLTLVGDASQVIPAGSIVATDDGIEFALVEDETLDSIGVNSTAVAQAVLEGEVQAPAGTVSNIVTPVEGWTTVTNVLAASPGRNDETDGELRIRRRLSMQIAGGRSLGALLGNILALPFITSAVVVENDQATTRIVDGVSMPPNSMMAVVTPNPLTTSQATLLAQTIFALAPMGIQVFGDQPATVTGADGGTKSVPYNHPIGFNVSTQITYSVLPGAAASTVEALIETAVNNYFTNLSPSEEVNRLDITVAVSGIEGLKAFSITLQGVDADVDIASTQVGVRTTIGSTIIEVS